MISQESPMKATKSTSNDEEIHSNCKKEQDGCFQDFAKEPVSLLSSSGKTRGGLSAQLHFPTLLHTMLAKAEKDNYSHICSWQSHGRCFVVLDRNVFVRDVMPLYFRQTKYASFQRQLNLYGFRHVFKKGRDHGAYYHEMFLRSRPDLCERMQRSNESSNEKDGSKSSRVTKGEPDFYSMEFMPETTSEEIAALLSSDSRGASGVSQASIKGTQRANSQSQPQQIGMPGVHIGMGLGPLHVPFECKRSEKSISKNDQESWLEPTPIAPGHSQNQRLMQSASASDAVQPPVASLHNQLYPPYRQGSLSSFSMASPSPALTPAQMIMTEAVPMPTKASQSAHRTQLLDLHRVDSNTDMANVHQRKRPACSSQLKLLMEENLSNTQAQPKRALTKREQSPHFQTTEGSPSNAVANTEDASIACFLDDVDLEDSDDESGKARTGITKGKAPAPSALPPR